MEVSGGGSGSAGKEIMVIDLTLSDSEDDAEGGAPGPLPSKFSRGGGGGGGGGGGSNNRVTKVEPMWSAGDSKPAEEDGGSRSEASSGAPTTA